LQYQCGGGCWAFFMRQMAKALEPDEKPLQIHDI
jgi:hypothetical protein